MMELDAQDAKLVTLARGARGRIGARSGASLRDELGRTYSAAEVHLPSLALSALQLVVAQAVAAGARGCECAVLVVADDALDPAADPGMEALRDLAGGGVQVIVCGLDGEVVSQIQTRHGD